MPAQIPNMALRASIKDADEMEIIKFWNNTPKID